MTDKSVKKAERLKNTENEEVVQSTEQNENEEDVQSTEQVTTAIPEENLKIAESEVAEDVDVAQPDAEALSQMFMDQAKKKLKAQKAKRQKRKKALLLQLQSTSAASPSDDE